jgi:DNA (cytosine-5)-methyltransferase 1
LASIVDIPRHTDIITAGFPCQPFSNAAAGKNIASKDLWPETFNVIRAIRSTWVLLENVPGKRLQHIERACCDLESINYAVWPIDIAVEVNKAVRRRIYVLAHSNECGEPQCPLDEKTSSIQAAARRWRGIPEPLAMDDGLPGKMDRMRALGDSIRVYDAEMILRVIT